MYRNSTRLGGAGRKHSAIRFALASALGLSMIAGGAMVSSPAFAKDKKKEEPAKEVNTKAFAEVYQPVATIANTANGDYAAAKAQVPAIIAAIGNQTDRFAAGQLVLVIGNKMSDRGLQRQGLELMLQSGKVDPAKVGEFQFFVGNLAYDAKDWDASRTALQAAIDAGYSQNDPQGLIAATYFNEGQTAQGLQYYKDQIAALKAAGKPVPDDWLRRCLKVAYDAKMVPDINQFSTMLVSSNPSTKNWTDAIEVVSTVNRFDSESQLDLMRLARATGALTDRRAYVSYIEAADPRRLPSEVQGLLDAGLKAGVFTADDQFYKENKATADTRAAADHKDAASNAAEAEKSPDGAVAQGAGDVYFSFGEYDKAAHFYQMALDKGVKDRDLILTHLGISQANQGQYDAAKATFAQVTGARAPVAKMWAAYSETKTAA